MAALFMSNVNEQCDQLHCMAAVKCYSTNQNVTLAKINFRKCRLTLTALFSGLMDFFLGVSYDFYFAPEVCACHVLVLNCEWPSL